MLLMFYVCWRKKCIYKNQLYTILISNVIYFLFLKNKKKICNTKKSHLNKKKKKFALISFRFFIRLIKFIDEAKICVIIKKSNTHMCHLLCFYERRKCWTMNGNGNIKAKTNDNDDDVR
jgi:hypothetical protein